MKSFEWDECFVTGLDNVDTQHRHLVDVINRFGELLMGESEAAPGEVERIFGELAHYADYHFRDEEDLMRVSGLDSRHIEAHCRVHQSFLNEVTRLHSGLTRGDSRAAADFLLQFLIHWLAYHILGQDQVMARQMRAISEGKTPAQAYESESEVRDPATATLLNALNRLFHQVSERNQELHHLNETLEARVAERTRALSEANQRLESMAMTDTLTGLPNRRQALSILQREWRSKNHSTASLCCIMVDADSFKAINDAYGHDAGDTVLRRLAQQLVRSVRNDDIVCRLGGDEFFVICPNTPLIGGLKVAGKIHLEVSAMRVHVPGGVWVGSVSVGVAARAPDMVSFEELMKAADEGVYLAKHRGRNRVETSQPVRSGEFTPHGRSGFL